MGRNTFYSFGMDLAADVKDAMVGSLHVLKARTDRENDVEIKFAGLNIRFAEPEPLRGRTRDLGIIDDGNFRLEGTWTGRLSSSHTNLTSLSRKHRDVGPVWVDPQPPPVVDNEAMRMICDKAGETTAMTDPYQIVKFNGPPDRSRAYG